MSNSNSLMATLWLCVWFISSLSDLLCGMPSRRHVAPSPTTALRRPTNLTSLRIDRIPYGFKCRMLGLVSHKNLLRLRNSSHSLKKLTDRRGYFARNLVIGDASDREDFIRRASKDNHKKVRFLTPQEAAALQRPIYVENCINFKYSYAHESINKAMLKNIVPCYTTLMVTEGLRVRPMINLIHSKLLITAIADRSLHFNVNNWDLFLNTLSSLSESDTFAMFAMLVGVVSDEKLQELTNIFNMKPVNIYLHPGEKAVVYEAKNCVKFKPPFVYAFPGGHLNLEDRLIIRTPIAKDNKWLNVSISDQNDLIVFDYLPYLWRNMSNAKKIKIELVNTYGIKIFVNDQYHRIERHQTDDPAADYWKLMCDIDEPVGPFDVCIIRNRNPMIKNF